MGRKEIPGQPQLDSRRVSTDELVEAWMVHALDSAGRLRQKAAVRIDHLLTSAAKYIPNISRHDKIAGSVLFGTLAVAAGIAVLLNSGESEVRPSVQPKPITPRRNFLYEYLNTRGINGQPSFLDKMRAEGVGIYEYPVLGRRVKVASAGKEGLLVRPVPHTDNKRFPEIGYLEWGDCFIWRGAEVVSANPDGSYDLYAVVPEGFVRLHRVGNGQTKWFAKIDDPKCKEQLLPDGSRIFDQKRWVVGPSDEDIRVANPSKG